MKKIISFILCIITVIAFCIPVFAEDSTGIDAANIIMGDTNLDGKVNAKDARTALRMAAKLDKNTLERNSYDTDGDGRLSASDARKILRVSAKLDVFTTGFGTELYPNVLNALKNGTYTMTAVDSGMSIKLSVYKNTDYIMDIPENLFNTTDLTKNQMEILFGFVPTQILIKDSVIYFTGTDDENNTVAINMTTFLKDQDETLTEELEEIKFATRFADITMSSIEETVKNEQTVIKYSGELSNGNQCEIYVNSYGELIAVAECHTGTVMAESNFTSFTGNVNSKTLDLSNYIFYDD